MSAVTLNLEPGSGQQCREKESRRSREGVEEESRRSREGVEEESRRSRGGVERGHRESGEPDLSVRESECENRVGVCNCFFCVYCHF